MSKRFNDPVNGLEGIYQAFHDCCKHKMSSVNCSNYRAMSNEDLPILYEEMLDGTYTPSESVTFCVRKPKVREIFAANFRDRIVQHWSTIRFEPLIEKRFVEQGDVSFNCRKGYGTQRAVNKLAEQIWCMTDGYTKEAWIGRYDIKGFFMNINKEILWNKLEVFVREKYERDDIELLLNILKKIVFHCPQHNCRRKGDLTLWDILPKEKSLFHKDDMTGMPIGNITSQLLANFYMSFFDEFMMDLCKKYCATFIRFVDDFVIVTRTKYANKKMRDAANKFLAEELKLELHPDKVYLQPASHGVKFIGSYIKPNRIYTSNRTVKNFVNTARKIESFARRITNRKDANGLYRNPNDISIRQRKTLWHYVAGVNSLLGFLCHTRSYNIVTRVFSEFERAFQFISIRKDRYAVVLNHHYTKLAYYINDNRNYEILFSK